MRNANKPHIAIHILRLEFQRFVVWISTNQMFVDSSIERAYVDASIPHGFVWNSFNPNRVVCLLCTSIPHGYVWNSVGVVANEFLEELQSLTGTSGTLLERGPDIVGVELQSLTGTSGTRRYSDGWADVTRDFTKVFPSTTSNPSTPGCRWKLQNL